MIFVNNHFGHPRWCELSLGMSKASSWPRGSIFLAAEVISHGITEEERTALLDQLLEARARRRKTWSAGGSPGFLEETARVREGDWRISPLPTDLLDRRVEITGPVDRKMIINALNSDAKVFMADFEDSSCPTWENVVLGQVHLRDAVARFLEQERAEAGDAIDWIRERSALKPDR